MSDNLDLIEIQLNLAIDNYITALLKQSSSQQDNKQHDDNADNPTIYQQAYDAMMRRLIALSLQWANNNQSKVAKKISISRGTLRLRMKQYNIDIPKNNNDKGAAAH